VTVRGPRRVAACGYPPLHPDLHHVRASACTPHPLSLKFQFREFPEPTHGINITASFSTAIDKELPLFRPPARRPVHSIPAPIAHGFPLFHFSYEAILTGTAWGLGLSQQRNKTSPRGNDFSLSKRDRPRLTIVDPPIVLDYLKNDELQFTLPPDVRCSKSIDLVRVNIKAR